MIVGIGVDIIRVERVRKTYARHGQRFVERLLHARERAAFEGTRRPADFLAKAFAAKEAFVKALGTGFQGIAHDEVGVLRDRAGRPQLVFGTKLKRRLTGLRVKRAHVSLSDEGEMVCAVVVLER